MGSIRKHNNLVEIQYSLAELLEQPFPFQSTTLSADTGGPVVLNTFKKHLTFRELLRHSALNLVRTKTERFQNMEPQDVVIETQGDQIIIRMGRWKANTLVVTPTVAQREAALV